MHKRLTYPITLLAIVAMYAMTAPGAFAQSSGKNVADTLATQIAQAHNRNAWPKDKAIQTDIQLEFGGRMRMEATMLYDMHTGKSRIEMDSGEVLVFDGEKAWASPSDADVKRARFNLLTWPYFLAAPFKLDDPGANLQETGIKMMGDTRYETGKMTFDAGVGDSPDDWYIVYAKPRTHQLEALAYIVTYGTPVEEAEQSPHAIVYDKYKSVDGVRLSTDWQFRNWSKEKGLHGDPLGRARLTNLKFVTPDADAFVKPEDAKEDTLSES